MDRGALILFGESFRLGDMHNRNTGTPESVKEQLLASNRHIEFVKLLEQKYMINMDIYVQSYSTPYNDKLNTIYKPYLKSFKYNEKLMGQENLIQQGIKSIDNFNELKFILCMRIDIYLKDFFFECYNPDYDKITFPFIGLLALKLIGRFPRVCDMMIHIPKIYFYNLDKIRLNHETWHDLVSLKIYKYDDFDVILDTFYDTNSRKDLNPFYYIVNRERATRCINNGQNKFDKYKYLETNVKRKIN